MADHDPLCPVSLLPDGGCRCALIARVRADERDRLFASVRGEAMTGRSSWSVECLTDRDAECDGCLCTCHIRAAVAEEIAQAIEADEHAYCGDPRCIEDGCAEVIAAAAIARRIGGAP